MNKAIAGAVLMSVLAAAGFVWDRPMAVAMVIATCALAFVTEELRDFGPGGHLIALIPALLSWATTAAAVLALIF